MGFPMDGTPKNDHNLVAIKPVLTPQASHHIVQKKKKP
jgi:hypothetical protein